MTSSVSCTINEKKKDNCGVRNEKKKEDAGKATFSPSLPTLPFVENVPGKNLQICIKRFCQQLSITSWCYFLLGIQWVGNPKLG